MRLRETKTAQAGRARDSGACDSPAVAQASTRSGPEPGQRENSRMRLIKFSINGEPENTFIVDCLKHSITRN